MTPIQLSINGTRRSLTVDPAMPLLWALRDHLTMFGTKYGCGVGTCGACTVHLDGQAVRACQVTVQQAVGHEVTTIEGLSSDGSHPCQVAWLEADVAQCGFCQPGMIMEVAALLGRNPAPPAGDVEQALASHVCRCGTYNRIRAAVVQATTLARSR
jgi:aerobic-type carbon monoxide dehydrogenase small subunit (CoxS/CutS family)